MTDVERGAAWVPADFRITSQTAASLLVMSLESSIAVRFTEYLPSGARQWMRDWLVGKRNEYQRQRPGELDQPTGMISLTARIAADGKELELEEARVATYPAVPEHWPERSHRELIDRAIAFLESP